MPIPYMGSKRKIAAKIIDFIVLRHGRIDNFYDLFGGGAAISEAALRHDLIKTVHYNELNTAVVELLRKIITDGVTNEFYQWIDRDTFNLLKMGDCWKSGLVKTCWSFGNNQRTYLFGEDAERNKKLAHFIVVDQCRASLDELNRLLGIDISMPQGEEINDRRLSFRKQIVALLGKRFDLQQLLRLQQLERLGRLGRLEQLIRLEQLKATNKSYKDVEIADGSVIYLDPPYKGTGKYQHDICHDELLAWINKQTVPVYLSSYEFEGLHEVKAFRHASTLAAKTVKPVIEKLFCNDVAINQSIKMELL